MWGERNCHNFETAVGGIEPPLPAILTANMAKPGPRSTNQFIDEVDVGASRDVFV